MTPWRTPAVAVVCGGLILTLCLGIRQSFGLYLAPMTEAYGWGRETFSFALAIQNLTWGLAQPLTGMIADRYGAGRVAVTGGMLYALGLLLMPVSSIRCVVAPGVPNNAGSFRPVTITAPDNCLLNVRRPAPVAARHIVGLFLPDAVIGALAHAVPDRVVAEGSSSPWIIDVRGRDLHDRPFAYAFFVGGGMGARSNKDGLSATHFPSTVRSAPVEVIESVSPIVIHRRALAAGTGGAGRYRGGLGVHYEIGVRTERDYLFAASFERIRTAPRGLFGGQPGAPGSLTRGDGEALDPKAKHWMAPTDRIVLRTPGSGGVGDPALRDPKLVEADIEAGVSATLPGPCPPLV